MKNKIILLSAIFIGLLATSCVKQQLETVYNKQEDQIDQYITRSMVTTDESGNPDTLRVVRNGGSNRLVLKEGIGDELAKDGYVSFYYAGYTFSGSVSSSNLFTTNRLESATEAGWSTLEAEYTLYEINLQDAELIPGLKDGLEGVRAGEECEILFSAKYGYGNKPLGMIPAKTALLYKIWVVGVTND
ncbi:MAG: FKBP-type peptidyl-prolyl cis-trans isomerase [Bacteroidales bacterium]|nr:FKBP-type peptidyl-prolyl cis-trans isomerase [Bacteroidales bacterium]